MRVPHALELVILALAAWRTYRLLAFDVILQPLRERLIRRAEDDGYVYVGEGEYRPTLDKFVHCPYCLGFWLCVAWWVAYLVWPHGAVWLAVPWALSGVLALIEVNHDAGDPDAWAEAEQEADEPAR